MSSAGTTAHPKLLNGDTSVWRICLVTKQWKNIFTLHELRHYQTIGYKDQDIEIGDLILIEGFSEDRLSKLFPKSQAAVKDWEQHVQIFALHHIDGEGWRRILKTVPAPKQPERATNLDLRELHGFEQLPPAIRDVIYEIVEEALGREVDPIEYLQLAKDTKESKRCLAAIEAMVEFLQDGDPLPEPEPLPRHLTKKMLVNRFQDSKHAFAQHFGDGWPWPNQEALDACIAKLRKSGAPLDDPVRLQLPEEVLEVIAKSAGSKTTAPQPSTSSKTTGPSGSVDPSGGPNPPWKQKVFTTRVRNPVASTPGFASPTFASSSRSLPQAGGSGTRPSTKRPSATVSRSGTMASPQRGKKPKDEQEEHESSDIEIFEKKK